MILFTSSRKGGGLGTQNFIFPTPPCSPNLCQSRLPWLFLIISSQFLFNCPNLVSHPPAGPLMSPDGCGMNPHSPMPPSSGGDQNSLMMSPQHMMAAASMHHQQHFTDQGSSRYKSLRTKNLSLVIVNRDSTHNDQNQTPAGVWFCKLPHSRIFVIFKFSEHSMVLNYSMDDINYSNHVCMFSIPWI